MRVALSLCVVVAAMGCDEKKKINTLADAPLPQDSGVDAAPRSVTLTVRYEGAPRAGVVVLFQAPDSALVARVLTDAQGVARAQLDGGGYVTAVSPYPIVPQQAVDTLELYTFAGARPGDELRLEDGAPPSTLAFTLRAPDDPQASSYQLWTTCGSQELPGGGGSGSSSEAVSTLIELSGCRSPLDLIVESFDGAGGSLAAIAKLDVSVAPGGTVDLLADAYADTGSATLTYAGIPSMFGGLTVEQELAGPRGQLHRASRSIDLVGGAGTVVLRRPTLAGQSTVTRTELSSGGWGRHTVIDWGAQSATYTLAGAGLLLEEYQGPPTFTQATRRVAWAAAGGVAPQVAIASLRLARDGAPLQWTWQIAGAPTERALTLPTLPGAEAIYNATPGDGVTIDGLITAAVPGGYDGVRAAIFVDRGVITGAAGRIVAQELQPAQLASRRPARPSAFGTGRRAR